jgi:hypothetical protein
MWDHHTALQPATVKEIQTVLFLRKLPSYIRDLINPREFQEPEALIQRCNEIWEDRSEEEGAAAVAILRPHPPSMVTAAPPLCSVGRVPLASSPTAVAPRPAQGRRQRSLVFLPLPFRFQGQEVREGLLIPFTAVSFLPAKNLIFLQDTKNNFKFLVDSDVSLLILPHTSTGPPTGPHLVGANGKPIPAWGFRCRTICFSGQNFEFDFLLAAVATPLLGIDFFSKIWSFNNPLKTAGPTRGLGPHLLQDK